MIFKRWTLAAGLLGGALLVSPPALAESHVGAPSPDQLKAALLVPEDLGTDFVLNKIRNRDPLDPHATHTKACAKAIKGLVPLYRSKTATWLMRDGVTEGVSQFVVSGSAARVSGLERAAKVMVRDCGHVKARSKGVTDTIGKLSVGKLGSGTYGIKFRSMNPSASVGPTMAVDIVIIRDENTMVLLEHSGFYGRFESGLTRTAAAKAAAKLQEALNGSADS
ncbi:hypothetical protein [Nonomuraea sp. NEAU-A123]|uniref:hypothetical protein n=1 Tax=Nonomuraea sp. NEAU-A123 TaxID=2839649 RepID=UPI001BE47F36|nr:hypothetical protein [Nonomuraea sp. NEAU-A123]MBT2224728.1 hypothetical protein [Nonomuraea sp. NEAU-A123]